MKKLFGTDGVRGVANVELTPEISFQIGRISAYLLGSGKKEGEDRPFFLIGKDTRRSGDMLEGALLSGINSSGIDAYCLGILSTPALAYLTRELGAVAGIIISASHNPIEDNGLKIFDPCGVKIPDRVEQEIERVYQENLERGEDSLPRPSGAGVGRAWERKEAVDIYLDYLRKLGPDLSGFRVIMDCGHGAVYQLAPDLFRSLGSEVEVLHNNPNGVNINVDCGSTNPSRLQQAVKEKRAHLGLAFDGDADRLIAVDEKGEIADGDLLMFLFSLYLHNCGRLRRDTLVATVMSNAGLEAALQERGISMVRTRVGDRYVLEEIQEGGYSLGGEQSGHIIFSEHGTTGDGLLTALQLARVLREDNKPLSYYREVMPCFPQVMLNCRVERKEGWEELPRFKDALKEVESRLGPFGRVLVRPSGTEPLMRVMVEGEKEEAELEAMAENLCRLLADELNGVK